MLPLSSQSHSAGFAAAHPRIASDRLHPQRPPGLPPASTVVKQEPDTTMDTIYPSTETVAPPPVQKKVTFNLLLSHSHQRARLPMTVDILPHDSTDSIISTVRNFFGLYDRSGLAFEDDKGTTLIARYENFTPGMNVNIRITSEEPDMRDCSPTRAPVPSPRRARLEDKTMMLPPIRDSLQSPQGRRSTSASASHKFRPKLANKNRGSSSHGSFADTVDYNEGSDSDGGSISSSRRSKKALVASAEISEENIVEGGRRKRQKFLSSELPLYIPSQVPETASLSSISPQKRLGSHNGASPSLVNQYPTWAHPYESPQTHGEAAYHHGLPTPYTTPGGISIHHGARYNQYASRRQSGNVGMPLPTPDATNSVISDEDVARQLMRLGEPSNFSTYSTHGRTSTSTLDDTLSRNAQMSTDDEDSEADTDREHDLPPLPYNTHVDGPLHRKYEAGESSGDDYEDNRDESFKGESDQMLNARLNHARVEPTKPRTGSTSKAEKSTKPRAAPKSKSKASHTTKQQPISPSSMPPQSRKASSASVHQHQPQLAADEEDLSAKPRCQRCRKSKKGCDRMRPCGRCKDAGIGIEGCISEDEAAGRKGRYGRHMGISVKKQEMGPPDSHAGYSHVHPVAETGQQGFAVPLAVATADKNGKKRKR